jgi:hypothetical protein
MEDMRADGVKVVCVVPDASGVRSTLDAHRMQGEHQGMVSFLRASFVAHPNSEFYSHICLDVIVTLSRHFHTF